MEQLDQKEALPEDLLEVEVDRDQNADWEAGKPVEEAMSASEPERNYWDLFLLFLILFGGAICWWLGHLQRQGRLELFRLAPETSMSPTELASHNGVTLMFSRKASRTQIIVEKSGQPSWFLVSEEDATARSPALCPFAERVAHLTDRLRGAMEIVALTVNTRQAIGTFALDEAGERAGLGDVKLCSWTPLAWSPTGERLAFFGCEPDDDFSVVVVADVSSPDPSLSLIGASRSATAEDRQVEWLNDSHMVVTTPSGDAAQPTVETFAVP